MPKIPYLNGGEELTAALMNTLTEEGDRRASLALDNHSILFLQNESGIASREDFAPYLGPVFTFGTVRLASYWSRWAYDHSIFEDAVIASVPYSGSLHALANEAKKWYRINPLPSNYFTTIGRIKSGGNADWRMSASLFQFSLEAHRKLYTKTDGTQELFWLWETYSTVSDTSGTNAFPWRLVRSQTFDQAELVFEGVSGTYDIPYKWNRFQFFRLHKLDAGPLTVRFLGSTGTVAHTVEVEEYSSKCVRRDSPIFPNPVWTYTTGYRYFQKFLPGDPRFYQHRAGGSSGANNVCNPSLHIPFVDRLLAGYVANRNSGQASRICRPTAFLDHSERGPLPTGDSQNPFLRSYGSIYENMNGDSLLGDVLHCRGEFWEVKSKAGEPTAITVKQFTSYDDLGTAFQTQEVAGEFQIKTTDSDASFKHDILAISTNFFCSPNQSRPVANVDDWLTLNRSFPLVRDLKVEQTTTAQVVSYNSVTAGGGLGAVNNRTITRKALGFVRAGTNDLPKLTDTIEDAKARYFGQHSNIYSVFFTIGVKNSSSGLVLYGEQTIPLDAPFGQALGNLPNLDWSFYLGVMFSGNVLTPEFQPSDAGLGNQLVTWRVITQTEKGLQYLLVLNWAVTFTENGWPDVDGLQHLPYCYSGFLTARQTRTYSSAPVVGGTAGAHPDFDYEERVDGRDFVYVEDVAVFNELAAQLPTPLNSNDYQYAGEAGRLNNPDVLCGAIRNAAVEDYWVNNRARLLLNQIYTNTPADGSDLRHFPGSPIAQGYYFFVRMEMAVEHYNNIAAKWNSIARIKPLNWEDHGIVPHPTDLDSRLRIRPNANSILDAVRAGSWFLGISSAQRTAYNTRMAQWTGLRPANQYAAFSTGDLIETALTAAGIVPSTINELPDSFALLKNKPSRTTRLKLIGNVTFTDTITGAPGFYDFFQIFRITHTITNPVFHFTEAQENYTEAGPCRPDLASVLAYKWVSKEQVQTYAEAHGYIFSYAKIGVGYDLVLYDIPASAPNSSLPITVSIPQDRYIHANYAANLSLGGSPPYGVESEFVIAQPVPVELESGASFTSRALEFVPGTHWIAGGDIVDASAYPFPTNVKIQQQEMDWADVLPSFTSGAFADTIEREACVVIETPSVPAQFTTVPGLGCDGVTRTLPWIQKNKSSISVSMAAQNVTLSVSELFRRVNYSNFFGLPATARNPVEYTSDLICREPLIVSVGENSIQTIEIPIEWLKFTPNFSSTSADAAKARATYGTVVLPFTLQTTGGYRVQLWADFTQTMD